MEDCSVAVVLPAAGKGVRLRGSIPKQFMELNGVPLLCHTVRAFQEISWIDHIIIVVAGEYQQFTEQLLEDHQCRNLTITTGDNTRFRSIRNGLRECQNLPNAPNVVIIHDAVRPFIDEQILQNVVQSAHEFGASGVVVPSVSTILTIREDGFMEKALNRSLCVCSEMPQAFQFDVISTAFQKCTEEELDHGTECLHIAQQYGEVRNVKLIPGSPNFHWKVTYPEDIQRAEDLLKRKAQATESVSIQTSPL